MREQARRPEQAEAVIDIGIVGGIREQAGDLGDLLPRLGEVRLHQHARMALQEFAGRRQLRRPGGDREAGRDGVAQPALPVPAGVEALARAQPAFGAVAERGGGIAVHQRLAGGERHAAPRRRREQPVRGLLVDGGEDERGRRAVGQQQVEEDLGGGGGMGPVRIARLLGKGEAAEPVQQAAPAGGGDAVLREMDMRIDEPRQDQPPPVIPPRRGPERRRQRPGRAPPGNAPAPQRQRAARKVAHRRPAMRRRVAGKVDQPAQDDGIGAVPGRRRAATGAACRQRPSHTSPCPAACRHRPARPPRPAAGPPGRGSGR